MIGWFDDLRGLQAGAFVGFDTAKSWGLMPLCPELGATLQRCRLGRGWREGSCSAAAP